MVNVGASDITVRQFGWQKTCIFVDASTTYMHTGQSGDRTTIGLSG